MRAWCRLLCLLLFSVPFSNAVPLEGHSSKRRILEGDILGVSVDALKLAADKGRLKDGITDERLRWPNAIVPFVFSPEYTQQQEEKILSAMKGFADETCVCFVPRTTEQDYLLIAPGIDCSSYIGRAGGRQVVDLVSGCLDQIGTIQHELMHAVGFYHEQARKDRDKYVDIKWDNIEAGARDQFFSYSWNMVDEPYDFGSVMHYDEFMFSRNAVKGLWTIRAKPEYKQQVAVDSATRKLGQRMGMSLKDVAKVNRMYKCAGKAQRECGATVAEAVPSSTQISQISMTSEAVKIDLATTEATALTADLDSVENEYEVGSDGHLAVGKVIWNINKNVKFELRTDGNAVLTRICDGSVIWETRTSNPRDDPLQSVHLERSGNLVLRSLSGAVVWSSGTTGQSFSGSTLLVTNLGTLCIFKDDVCLWDSGGLGQCQKFPLEEFESSTIMMISGRTIKPGRSILSAQKNCKLSLQLDGDLVLRRRCDDAEIWSVRHGAGRSFNLGNEVNDKIREFKMATDGNLIMRRESGGEDFKVVIPDAEGADLRVNSNCQMCVFKDGLCLWTAQSLTNRCT
ncbi:putative Zinc metalloproteinase nas-4 [Hypsibius exemplaris]|uniref:Metalloendopeptidase n=1 Tax=Hypsibius exemplaris TaxID=2072580 RepID=A0A1W0WNE1_HYPEX|nr:putative Zinc metalloproteinase nas-4 [Hypsibius exemplaris]